MLVLTRKTTEQIVIGVGQEQVVVRVLHVLGDRVRLGIAAPHNIPVHRDEIWQRIVAEQKAAAPDPAAAW